MPLKGLVRSPGARLPSGATIQKACQAMHDTNIGAVAVVDGEKLEGVFTYRDLIDRVILRMREPGEVTLGEVMTRDVEWISIDRSPGDALRLMVEKDYTHLPVLDETGRLAGVVTLRSLLEHKIHQLADELDVMTSYLSIDGSGGN